MADTMFTRANPSPRYRELVELYRTMHTEGERFLDVGAGEHVPRAQPAARGAPGEAPDRAHRGAQRCSITARARAGSTTSATSRLDDGRGRREHPGLLGRRLRPLLRPELREVLSKLPTSRFDGVISTDVLEHCPEDDLRVDRRRDLRYAEQVRVRQRRVLPGVKRLPTGENAHCTVEPPGGGSSSSGRVAARSPDVDWELCGARTSRTPGAAAQPSPVRPARPRMDPVGSSSATIRARRSRSASSRTASTRRASAPVTSTPLMLSQLRASSPASGIRCSRRISRSPAS